MFHVFIDVSANSKFQVGIGSRLILDHFPVDISTENLLIYKSQVESSMYNEGRSTNLELLNMHETLLEIPSDIPVTIYTDCQCAVDIYDKMMANKSVNYYKVSRVLRERMDLGTITIVKVKGHNKQDNKDLSDLLFSLVDKRSRKLLRLCVNTHKINLPLLLSVDDNPNI